jgi:hypothetical protein
LGLGAPLALAWAWGRTTWLDPLSFVSLQGVCATWAWLWLPLARRDASDGRPLLRALWGAGLAAWLWAVGWTLDAAHGREPWPWTFVVAGCLGVGAISAVSAAGPRRRTAWAALHLASVLLPCALATANWAGRPEIGKVGKIGESGSAAGGAALGDWLGPALWSFEAWFADPIEPSTPALVAWIVLPLLCWLLPAEHRENGERA